MFLTLYAMYDRWSKSNHPAQDIESGNQDAQSRLLPGAEEAKEEDLCLITHEVPVIPCIANGRKKPVYDLYALLSWHAQQPTDPATLKPITSITVLPERSSACSKEQAEELNRMLDDLFQPSVNRRKEFIANMLFLTFVCLMVISGIDSKMDQLNYRTGSEMATGVLSLLMAVYIRASQQQTRMPVPVIPPEQNFTSIQGYLSQLLNKR